MAAEVSKADNDNDIKVGARHVETRKGSREKGRDVSLGSGGVGAKKLVWKCDLHVLPSITVLYFLAFMDRTNIGKKCEDPGLSEDLNMTGRDYNLALFIFFIPYILFEVPSNLIIKRVAPSTWLSLIMVLWGIATIGQGLVTNVSGLVGCRFVLGIFEAGVFPGIFIIEGLLTVAVGAAAKFWVADWPERAAFLTDGERRLAADSGAARMDKLNRRAARRIAMDWKIYAGTLAYFGVVNTGYAGSFFIPTILNQMGLTATAAQVRTIPLYVAATAVCLLVSHATDRLRHRYSFALAGLAVAIIGYILLLCPSSSSSPSSSHATSVGVRYFALFLVVSGGYTTQPVTLAWLANAESGHYKRAVSSAAQVGLGNAGGLVASNVFFDSEQPQYRTGFAVSLAMLWVCAGACTWLYLGARRENRRRDRGERDGRLDEPNADNLGDDHPSWRLAT
ncbi:MFS general substrate transporter [Apiospora phragmitis]|uniref:MFS general substrate transporter n=1 Tax=Apiospora phragmitis TaxID=2905665 RepID=A0ABR1WSH4_9PEZI